MCHYKVSISTLSEIFDEKVGPFSEFLCLHDGGLQSTILRAVLGKNGFHFQKIFQNCGFFSPN